MTTPKVMPRKGPVEPKLVEIAINYNVSVKANLGNYENSVASVSKTERWNVEGMSSEAADQFWQERYQALHEELGELIEIEYKEMLGG